MKYTFHIVDVFSSTPFGGNQLAVLPDAVGISTEGMQKIAREFNFGETTFVLPKNDPANTCRVRIFTPRAELDFAGHPTVGTACALVMKQHVRLGDPSQLILEENVGPATGSACAALVGAMASKHDFGGTTYHLSIQQGVSMGRPSEIEAEAHKSGSVVTSVSVGGATAYIASGEIEVPPSALVSQTVDGAPMRVNRRQ